MVWITGPVLDALASCEGLPTRKCLHADVDLGMFGVLDVHLVPHRRGHRATRRCCTSPAFEAGVQQSRRIAQRSGTTGAQPTFRCSLRASLDSIR